MKDARDPPRPRSTGRAGGRPGGAATPGRTGDPGKLLQLREGHARQRGGRGGARPTADRRAPVVRDVSPGDASTPWAAGADETRKSSPRPPGGSASPKPLLRSGARATARPLTPASPTPGTRLLRGGGSDRRVRRSTVGIEVLMKRHVLWVPVVLLATGCGSPTGSGAGRARRGACQHRYGADPSQRPDSNLVATVDRDARFRANVHRGRSGARRPHASTRTGERSPALRRRRP